MTQQKPIFNSMDENGNMITFRQSLSAYAPKKEELQKLRDKISEIIGKETTPDFDDKLSYLITFLRLRTYNNRTAHTSTEMGKKVKDWEKALKNLNDFITADDGVSEEIHTALFFSMISKTPEAKNDPVYDLHCQVNGILELCEIVKKNIKGAKSDFTPNDMRQILAEELARELNKMSVKLAKSRNGIFEKCLRVALEAIRCSIRGEKIAAAIPDDLFNIASDAIDAYPNKEPYSLLDFD